MTTVQVPFYMEIDSAVYLFESTLLAIDIDIIDSFIMFSLFPGKVDNDFNKKHFYIENLLNTDLRKNGADATARKTLYST